jgi:hypothetical protein
LKEADSILQASVLSEQAKERMPDSHPTDQSFPQGDSGEGLFILLIF